ncbi:FHA domain protein [Vibrio aerogenes CECT 7868]|uniref:FHA domain protein n=1 Tax=Vibrio aerogenes CECT 7868 TaxID=1216006 RepID=A0A1M5XGA3_9VIBR|nr:FHA domain-containing protein [Vibrio aerogenes]SHH98263.1 FHA domain protein [Vibrio aerogenes CECT 7868]
MASLNYSHAQYPVFLKSFHQFGRLATKVDTVIDFPDVSRIHAVIEWHDAWYLRDLSKNGVRVNGQMISPHHPYLLKMHDQIAFSGYQETPFVVDDLEPPRDLLVPEACGPEPDIKPIYLERYHFLPSEHSPEIVLFYNMSEQEWQCEHVKNGETFPLKDGEILQFSHRMWRLIKGIDSATEETQQFTTQPTDELCYIFNISQDEELTELTIQDHSHQIDCEVRSHHYLTALLARYKAEDLKQHIPEPEQGWRSVMQLMKDMGLSETHLNIQIHRARKQIQDALLSEGLMAPDYIERKRGRVRLAVRNYQVIKGSRLEVDSAHLS